MLKRSWRVIGRGSAAQGFAAELDALIKRCTKDCKCGNDFIPLFDALHDHAIALAEKAATFPWVKVSE
jgi:hypothetical protein